MKHKPRKTVIINITKEEIVAVHDLILAHNHHKNPIFIPFLDKLDNGLLKFHVGSDSATASCGNDNGNQNSDD